MRDMIDMIEEQKENGVVMMKKQVNFQDIKSTWEKALLTENITDASILVISTIPEWSEYCYTPTTHINTKKRTSESSSPYSMLQKGTNEEGFTIQTISART